MRLRRGRDRRGRQRGRRLPRQRRAGARRLLTGSHYDTVRNGGKYDGRLGIFVPMACVRELQRAGRRLPFGFEVVGFAEEEGQRYKATFLGSGALIGHFDPRWLDQKDADGITMREAMRARRPAGDAGDDRRAAARPGATTSASSRCTSSRARCSTSSTCRWASSPRSTAACATSARCIGMASHAGTTPMDRRRDAAAAVAELALFVEQRAARGRRPRSAPIGMLEVPNGSINVVPGRCKFSSTCAPPTDAHARRAAPTTCWPSSQAICERRGVRYTLEETMRAAAAPQRARLAGALGARGRRARPAACTACPAAPATTR